MSDVTSEILDIVLAQVFTFRTWSVHDSTFRGAGLASGCHTGQHMLLLHPRLLHVLFAMHCSLRRDPAQYPVLLTGQLRSPPSPSPGPRKPLSVSPGTARPVLPWVSGGWRPS